MEWMRRSDCPGSARDSGIRLLIWMHSRRSRPQSTEKDSTSIGLITFTALNHRRAGIAVRAAPCCTICLEMLFERLLEGHAFVGLGLTTSAAAAPN